MHDLLLTYLRSIRVLFFRDGSFGPFLPLAPPRWYQKNSRLCPHLHQHTLPTKVHIVKAMVFLVVMYGCESWTIKKPEQGRIDAFQLVVLEKTLESSLDSKEIKPDHPKGNQP